MLSLVEADDLEGAELGSEAVSEITPALARLFDRVHRVDHDRSAGFE